MNKQRGITLIALVITIIILLILAGVTIATLTGENGILTKSKIAQEKNDKETATEIINLKITNIQVSTYTENQRMPTLQEVADNFYKDDEIEYLLIKNQNTASKEKIEIGKNKSFFTKLTKYPYEFEIDEELRLASIDGVKIATSESKRIEELEKELENLRTENEKLKTTSEKVKELENEINRIKAENENLKSNNKKMVGTFFGWKTSKDWNNAGLSNYTEYDTELCDYGASVVTIKEQRKIFY